MRRLRQVMSQNIVWNLINLYQWQDKTVKIKSKKGCISTKDCVMQIQTVEVRGTFVYQIRVACAWMTIARVSGSDLVWFWNFLTPSTLPASSCHPSCLGAPITRSTVERSLSRVLVWMPTTFSLITEHSSALVISQLERATTLWAISSKCCISSVTEKLFCSLLQVARKTLCKTIAIDKID